MGFEIFGYESEKKYTSSLLERERERDQDFEMKIGGFL
jgi:hypothetical protein